MGRSSSGVDHDPGERLEDLFDRGTARPLADPDDSGVSPARGRVDGTRVVAFAAPGGALDVTGARHIVTAVDAAVRERVPVVGLWRPTGSRPAEDLTTLDAAGRVFAATVRASGRIPQISVLLGPPTAAAGPGPARRPGRRDTTVGLRHRRTLAATPPADREPLRARLLAEETTRASAARATEHGHFDGIVRPDDTRRRLAEILAAAPAGRGNQTNIPL